ncbi:MAG: glucosamine-6-phosphate deaminase [Tannerella sp.]|jgi:glucosamine-6-phosphate deaminase|nr:glucosamine-6-phosphate deaminase [Tannerella sp.]
MNHPIETFKKDFLKIKVFETRQDLGTAAAYDLAGIIKPLFEKQEYINIVFASAPSQQEFLEEFCNYDDIEWHRINAFHLDEYLNLPIDAPQRFGYFLKTRLFDKRPFHSVYYLNGDNGTDEECTRYTELLRQYPIDIACLGIGENGHIAFNDPHVADFNDPHWVKTVNLDNICRQQQVNDGCFKSLNDVPPHALTLTISAIRQARYFLCMVPGSTKADALFHTYVDKISETVPSTCLRLLSDSTIYADTESASALLEHVKMRIT